MNTTPAVTADRRAKWMPATLGILLALLVFCILFGLVDQAYIRFIDARFPAVGDSAALATLYGLVSRAHLILPLLALALWRPRRLGFQMGQTRRY